MAISKYPSDKGNNESVEISFNFLKTIIFMLKIFKLTQNFYPVLMQFLQKVNLHFSNLYYNYLQAPSAFISP